MRFNGLDLNLLVALEVLLDSRSVSRAAERLHLSQPAVSAALGRMRAFFGDPLLVAHGRQMVPTALALSLRPRLKQFLADAETLVRTSSTFDPAHTLRTFSIATSDFVNTVLFAPLLARLAVSAPGISFDFVPLSDGAPTLLDSGAIDLLVIPVEHASQVHPAEVLFEEQHVVVGCAANPAMAQPITLEQFQAAGHIAVELGSVSRASFAEQHLKLLAVERRIEVKVSSFTLLPQLVIGTTRLAVMHERLAVAMSRHYPIAVSPIPFDLPPMREMLQHHRARTGDAGLQWLISEVHSATR